MDRNIKAFVFDWGGVLLNQTWKGQMAYAARALGVDPERLDAECHGHAWRLFVKGCISEQRFWSYVCGALGVSIPLRESLWYDALESVAKHQQDVWDIAHALRLRGFKIGLLSNLDMTALQWLENNGDLTLFHAKVYSCNEGMQKPCRDMYQLAVIRLQVEPQEAVMIDDKPDNIVCAQSAGLHGIHFRNTRQLREELLKFGVSV